MTVEEKLAITVIPEIKLHGATLPDAVEYLRQEAWRLDDQVEGSGAQRGIVLGWVMPWEVANDIHLNLVFHDCDLYSALTAIAEQAQLTLVINGGGAYLVLRANAFYLESVRLDKVKANWAKLADEHDVMMLITPTIMVHEPGRAPWPASEPL